MHFLMSMFSPNLSEGKLPSNEIITIFGPLGGRCGHKLQSPPGQLYLRYFPRCRMVQMHLERRILPRAKALGRIRHFW